MDDEIDRAAESIEQLIERHISAAVTEALRPIEGWVRQQIAQALSAHAGERPHLTDDDVQRIALDMQLGPAPNTGQLPVIPPDATQTIVMRDDPTVTRRMVRSTPPAAPEWPKRR
jgi:hypothetical protein